MKKKINIRKIKMRNRTYEEPIALVLKVEKPLYTPATSMHDAGGGFSSDGPEEEEMD